jgi:hypothetical protein
MILKVGSKVKFKPEKRVYTVQASDARFAICTKPFNLKRTVLYTVIDFEENVRGTENLIFGLGAETRQQCERMLNRLNGHSDSGDSELVGTAHKMQPMKTKVSYRNRVSLDIEKVF